MGARIFPDPRQPRRAEEEAESTSSLSESPSGEAASQVCLLIDSCGRRFSLDAFKSHLENIFPLIPHLSHLSAE